MIYCLSLGSNIAPQEHIGRALAQLCQQFHAAIVYPVLRTSPCAIESERSFLNTIAVIDSDWTPEQLKQWLNQLEEAHGRNRADPERSHKDRTLDIDILTTQKQLSWLKASEFTEPYVQASIHALQTPSPQSVIVQVSDSSLGDSSLGDSPLGKSSLGNRPATIYTNHSSGHIFVVEDTLDGLLQCFKTTLNRQQRLA